MSSKTIFVCDVCEKPFNNRDEKGNPTLVGGLHGMGKKDNKVMKYDFDLCEICSKKILDYYLQIGGK